MNGLSASAINWLNFVIEVVCETEARIFILCVSVAICAQGRASFVQAQLLHLNVYEIRSLHQNIRKPCRLRAKERARGRIKCSVVLLLLQQFLRTSA